MERQSQSSTRSRREFFVLLVAGMVMVAALATTGCSATPAAPPVETPAAPQAAAPATPTDTPAEVTKLEIKDPKVGKGVKVKTGDTVTVHYTGWLLDGTKFDSSLDGGTPFSFTVGEGRVIAGWEQGLVGMQVGGKRVLMIPSDLGYGAQANGPIPADSALKFEIELLKITPGN